MPPYEDVLDRFGRVLDFRIDDLDRLGVPVTSCSLLVDDNIAHHGNGYGADVEAARLSGLGELAEGVLGDHAVAAAALEAVDGSYAELVRRFGAELVIDPATLCLPAGSDYTSERPLRWVPAVRIRTGARVWLPIELVANEPAELGDLPAPALLVPITNGLGAGLDPDRAARHGVMEILQRHTNGLRFRALDRLSPVVDPGTFPAEIATLVERFATQGIEVVVKDAGSAFGVCSVYAMGVDATPASPIMVTACGEGADADPSRAVTKAVLEYANSRARKAFCFGPADRAEALAPQAYWDGLDRSGPGEQRAVESLQAWAALSTDELRELTAPVGDGVVPFDTLVPSGSEDWQDDLDVLAVQIEVDGVHVAKVVVPGLEVETLSYGRIGEHNARRSLELDLDLVRIGPGPSADHDHRVVLTPEAEERLGGPAWFSWSTARAIVGPLYPLYREPPRHQVTVS